MTTWNSISQYIEDALVSEIAIRRDSEPKALNKVLEHIASLEPSSFSSKKAREKFASNCVLIDNAYKDEGQACCTGMIKGLTTFMYSRFAADGMVSAADQVAVSAVAVTKYLDTSKGVGSTEVHGSFIKFGSDDSQNQSFHELDIISNRWLSATILTCIWLADFSNAVKINELVNKS